MHMPTKKYLRKKANKLCLMHGSNCDRKSQLSAILTEPLNPRDAATYIFYLVHLYLQGICLTFKGNLLKYARIFYKSPCIYS